LAGPILAKVCAGLAAAWNAGTATAKEWGKAEALNVAIDSGGFAERLKKIRTRSIFEPGT
jgi:hypothetical protein